MKCDCGAFKTYKTPPGGVGHSDWCSVSARSLSKATSVDPFSFPVVLKKAVLPPPPGGLQKAVNPNGHQIPIVAPSTQCAYCSDPALVVTSYPGVQPESVCGRHIFQPANNMARPPLPLPSGSAGMYPGGVHTWVNVKETCSCGAPADMVSVQLTGSYPRCKAHCQGLYNVPVS